jgi:monothiol glutaredoxin
MMTIQERIEKQLHENAIVLYMKGTPASPQCGFSSQAVHILKKCEVDYMSVNVLEDPLMREGIKKYGNWPTIPQLYVHGELIGGSDIMRELFESGELQQKLAPVSK